MNEFKIGSRTLKTGIAITLSIAICHALNMEPAIFAAVSAIINLQPTVYQSYINALQQIGITIIGITVGLSLALTVGSSALTIGVSSIIIILIALRLRWNSVILIGLVTVIFIVDTQQDFFIENSITRVSVIFIGLLVAMAVNVILAPSDYRKFTLDKLSQFHTNVTTLFYRKVSDFVNKRESIELDNTHLTRLLKETESMRDSINIYKNEIRVLPFSTQAKDLQERCELLEELYSYDVQLLNKILLIKDFERDRLERLAFHNVKTYSDSFQQIINSIDKTNEQILDNSKVLTNAIIDSGEVTNWSSIDMANKKLDDKIEAWNQEHVGDSHYMSALMEISIIIYEMRWIAREQNRLHEKFIKNDIKKRYQ